MNRRYKTFNREKVKLLPLSSRVNDLKPGFVLPLAEHNVTELSENEKFKLDKTAETILDARRNNANILFMLGGHVIRSGTQLHIIDLMEKGYIQGIAVNGSVAIHDYEVALQNATTESVAKYISKGKFGLWRETGRINDLVREGVKNGLGFGEALGRELWTGKYPYKQLSIFAQAWRYGIPVTVHPGIGYDIIHAHPNFDGAAVGAAADRDFLIFAQLVSGLEKGVLASFGSAVMAPEVFLKALSMVRNVALQENKNICHFSTLVCDLLPLPETCAIEAQKTDPLYYFRPWKTLLTRVVADGGKSIYVQGKHKDTIPYLRERILSLCNGVR